MNYDTQQVVTRKEGPPLKVRVARGGVNEKNLGKNVKMEEDEEKWT